jgi:tetratricopeptide (TPR) repeat protein
MTFSKARAGPLEISLRGQARALLFVLTVACLGLFLGVETLLAGSAGLLTTPQKVRWVLAHDPGNPGLEYRLGRIYEDADPGEGLRHLRYAAELSPHNQRYRYHLAVACESRGDMACADQAWVLLAELSPRVPLYHWHAGESYLRANRLNDSLAQFSRLLDLDAQYGPKAWFTLRSVLGPDVIFQKTVANHPGAELKVAYIDFLSRQGDDNTAYRIWRSVEPHLYSVPFRPVQPYLERLISGDRIDEAESVWRDLQRMGTVTAAGGMKDEDLIFNGDFEQTPLNAGFDWRKSDQTTYLAIDFAAPGAHRGARCLRVDFTVNRNEAYEPAYQIVPILPNHTYRLEAYVRSEDITSDTGPYLRVSDPQHLSFADAMSETTVGTTPWHSLQLGFSTGPEAQSVRLSIWRPRGRTFPMGISGSFWVDSVSLHDMGRAVEPVAAEGQR